MPSVLYLKRIFLLGLLELFVLALCWHEHEPVKKDLVYAERLFNVCYLPTVFVVFFVCFYEKAAICKNQTLKIGHAQDNG